MPIVVSGSATPDPARESFLFGGTDWNDYTTFRIQDFDPGIAPKRYRWVSGADSDGALSADEAHYDNAEMTMRIRIMPQASMDAALQQIGNLVLTLQECEKQPLGQAAVWTPPGSTKSLTAYVVGGEVTGIPKALTGDDAGWLLRNPAPVITLKLYRRPFLYGQEVTSAATVTNAGRFQLLTVAGVPGDVDAEARLVITDNASQSRRHVEWGLEQRYYDPATSLSIDTFVTSGFAGTSTTRAGSFNTNVIRATLTAASPVAVCGTGNLSHVGTFRAKTRIYGASTDARTISARLSWKEGDGPLRSNAWAASLTANGFCEVDLGLITIPATTLGAQRWTGQIEAYSAVENDTIDVDYLMLIPAGEGYGKARAPIPLVRPTPISFTARDDFSQSGGNLNGKTLPVGGTWATSGDATDLAVETFGHTAQRTTTADSNGRTALAGTSAIGSVVASLDYKFSSLALIRPRMLVRYTDASNFASLSITPLGTDRLILQMVSVVGGVELGLESSVVSFATGTWYTAALLLDTTGFYSFWWGLQGGPLTLQQQGYSPTLSTSSLAAGKVGFLDLNTTATACTRNYDNFWAAPYTPDAVAFSGRSAEMRHDSAIRQDSTGTYWGPMSTYRGARFFLPPAGSANRTSRIFVKARRNDIDVAADDQIADSTTATIHYTPRYYVAPR